jgi:hypothetical protein
MGLDFSNIRTRAKLSEGTYLAVQIPDKQEAAWNWNDWGFDPINDRIVSRSDSKTLIPYNYIGFSVSEYKGI